VDISGLMRLRYEYTSADDLDGAVMCEWGKTKKVWLYLPAELSCTGKGCYRFSRIDSCIADIIKALNKGGLKTIGSCCGHGKRTGRIDFMDGRIMEFRLKQGRPFKEAIKTAKTAMPTAGRRRNER